ncbi:G-type lectin S-receptor-like serine/threonine-protein kinase At5g24080 [Prosopis cineraria]|uniref:G-type lectin S-receptor-like serine/threonine-protein kinase At5g24080 n=1 Tax=Prosopis cineraria TaxID=364024 RepID=UPI00240FF5F2|nr:G-type lectin S-receptor-like serine/threonine-protein kinase At5g24080 [Prosopis cineraria]
MMSQPRFVILRLICLCAVIVGVIIIATTSGSTIPIIISSVVGFFMIKIALVILKTRKDGERGDTEVAIRPNSANAEFLAHTVDKFLNDIEKDKPIRFTSHQLMLATNNYSNKLGSGGFGAVYRGVLVDGSIVAVKVLHQISDHQRIEDQFMAEVGTIGRVHHLNLVRLFGFCFENNMRALVYEYMSNGSPDKYLFRENNILAFQKLHEIAVGTAKGMAYLHEECQQRIIHYDIKPENILLDQNFCPKVADFGLAKIFNREKSHVTMTGLRGTPGYAAPELWLPFPVTHRCDVYSFGMLLFEIIGRRRNHDMNLPESQEWFPRQVWAKFNSGKLEELTIGCGITDKEIVERMSKVALWCVQYRPELRPMMSVVAKMLEGLMDIPNPSNPFQHLMDEDHSIQSSN